MEEKNARLLCAVRMMFGAAPASTSSETKARAIWERPKPSGMFPCFLIQVKEPGL